MHLSPEDNFQKANTLALFPEHSDFVLRMFTLNFHTGVISVANIFNTN